MAERLPFDALQLALYARLTDPTNGIGAGYGGRVYDDVPIDPTFPYVEMGGFVGESEEGKARNVKAQTCAIHCFSKARGYRELNDLMNAVAQSVTAAEFGTITDDFAISNGSIRIDSFEAFKDFDDENGELYRHGILRVRVLSQDVL